MKQEKVEQAKEKMKILAKSYGKMDDRHKYHYHHNEGRLLFRNFDYKKGIEAFEKSREIVENNKDFDQMLLYRAINNIGTGYTHLCYPNTAITVLEKAIKGSPTDAGLSVFHLFANTVLGFNYAMIGMSRKAKELTYKALDYAERTGNKFYIASAYYDLGKIYTFSEDWDKGKESFEKARNLFEEGHEYHMWSCCNKAECMIGNREFKEAEKIMEETKALYPENERAKNRLGWLKSMHAISRGITQNKEKDVEYLLNKAIPDLLENNFILEAIKTYELLADHFERTMQKMRAGEMYKEINRLRKRLSVDT